MIPDSERISPPWQQFEDLVRRILETRGFQVTPHSPRGDAGFDYDGVLNNEHWAIEVKYYRTNRAQRNLIEAAAVRVARRRSGLRACSGMLVVSCSIPPAMRVALEGRFSVTFIDRDNLDRLASKDALLTEELQRLLGANLNPFFEGLDQGPDPFERPRPEDEVPPPAEETRGMQLCDQLHSIKTGKTAWSDYEKVAVEILKYLFEDDLEGWKAHSGTDDGLNRFDLACRISSDKFFWKFIAQNLNSIYVLFEFKNYSEKITQGEILTTEKYLLERAARRVAIMLTRKGAGEGAVKMTQGAMREHGKLILVIDDDAVSKMLLMKDRGEDPTDFLFELTDNFLLSLPR